MEHASVQQIYFSPAGTTRAVVERIAAGMGGAFATHNLLVAPCENSVLLPAGSVALVGVPVYAGRIPAPCAQQLARFCGEGAPAIAVVVYGNRDYDDALLELVHLLENSGFVVAAAAAFVAQHSLFPQVGAGRPDADDFAKIDEFAAQCAALLAATPAPQQKQLPLKGNCPYVEAKPIPLRPAAGKLCQACGACASICPTNAIDAASPKNPDKELCISCAACIHACPQKARAFSSPLYTITSKTFEKKYAARREPETFL